MRVKTSLSLRQRRMLGEDRWKMMVALVVIVLSSTFAYAGMLMQVATSVRESVAYNRREIPFE